MKNKSIEELVSLAAEGDEEAQAEIKERFTAKERESLSAKRELKLQTDPKLKERFPRALRAYGLGKLKLTDDMDEDDLLDALRDKEDELAELGVPVGTQATKSNEAAAAKADDSDDGSDDPAKALGGGAGASAPAPAGRDLVAEFEEAVKGPTRHDQAKAWRVLVELQKPEHMEKIKEITRRLEAPPITPSTI